MQIRTIALATLCAAQGACAGMAWEGHKVPIGAIYGEVSSTEGIVAQKLGSKRGEACAKSILGLVTTGDATASTAAKAAGISAISAVEHHSRNILGIYSEYCVQVVGD